MVHGNIRTWSSTPGLKGLERAFEYLSRTDLASLPLGHTDIEGDDVYVLILEGETKPPEQVRFEAHRRYIDIQIVVPGPGVHRRRSSRGARDHRAVPESGQGHRVLRGAAAVGDPRPSRR